MSIVKGSKLSEQQRESLAGLLGQKGAELVEQVATFAQSVADTAYTSGWSESKGEAWIPVTSHYPAPGERVLIFVPRWGLLTIGWISKSDSTRWEIITMPGKSTDQVSHWQPLPTGPLQPPT